MIIKPLKPMNKRDFLKYLRDPTTRVKAVVEIFPHVIETLEVSKEQLERLIAIAEVSKDGESMRKHGFYAEYEPDYKVLWVGKDSSDDWEWDK